MYLLTLDDTPIPMSMLTYLPTQVAYSIYPKRTRYLGRSLSLFLISHTHAYALCQNKHTYLHSQYTRSILNVPDTSLFLISHTHTYALCPNVHTYLHWQHTRSILNIHDTGVVLSHFFLSHTLVPMPKRTYLPTLVAYSIYPKRTYQIALSLSLSLSLLSFTLSHSLI